MTSGELAERRSSGLFWFWAPVLTILFVGGALSIGAEVAEPEIGPAGALVAGYGGLAALIGGLFVAAIGAIVGLFGAAIGLIVAGGATALTLFIVASPIIAIILLIMLMRRRKAECPDPAAH